MNIFVLALILLLMFIAIIFMPVKCEFHFTLYNNESELKFRLTLFKMTLMSVNQTFDLFDSAASGLDLFKWKHIEHLIQQGKEINAQAKLKKLKAMIRIRQLKWDTNLGTSDAFHTALICGWFWTIKALMYQSIKNFFHSPIIPAYSVQPSYYQSQMRSEVQCIFSMRLGQAIYAKRLFGKWKKKLKS